MFGPYATAKGQNHLSVTSQLTTSASPLSAFFHRELPLAQPVIAALNRELLNTPLLFPPASFKGGDWGTVGTAFDLRVRCYFSARLPETRSAMHGAGLVANLIAAGDARRRARALELWDRLLDRIRADLDRIGTARRRLDWDDEDRVNAHCVILTLFEQCFRARPRPEFPAVMAMTQALADDNIDALLELPKDHWLEDVRHLSWRFIETQHDLLHRSAVLNPVFAGSFEVGGADADLIVEDRLIELKTSRNALTKEDLYEALAYVLLDYNDVLHIERLALYAARRGRLVSWNVTDLVRALSRDAPLSIAELRARLHGALTPDFIGCAGALGDRPTGAREADARGGAHVPVRRVRVQRAWQRQVPAHLCGVRHARISASAVRRRDHGRARGCHWQARIDHLRRQRERPPASAQPTPGRRSGRRVVSCDLSAAGRNSEEEALRMWLMLETLRYDLACVRRMRRKGAA